MLSGLNRSLLLSYVFPKKVLRNWSEDCQEIPYPPLLTVYLHSTTLHKAHAILGLGGNGGVSNNLYCKNSSSDAFQNGVAISYHFGFKSLSRLSPKIIQQLQLTKNISAMWSCMWLLNVCIWRQRSNKNANADANCEQIIIVPVAQWILPRTTSLSV